MSSYADRLAALREQLKTEKLDGFVVPLTDEHMSEYVGSYAQRLAWLTGFQGSAGSAVVLPEEAAIFVDGRYTLQVRQQVSPDQWSYQSVPETSTTQWLEEHAPEGARIGYDPWLHTRDWVKKAKEALATRGAELVPVARNPIDEIWKDRPEASKAHLVVQPDQYAGKSAAEKRTEIGDWLAKHHADAAVLSALDSIAWAFNIRGQDVTHPPVALAYSLVHADGTADLFVAGEKIGPDVRQHLGNGVRLHERSEFESALDELKASDKLEGLRRENPELRDLSFDSISGAGPNGAIVHYKSSEKTNRKLEQGTLYLIDSGGQYVDGTTDITRTVPIGPPTDEMRDRFTRVLKGHIGFATAVFPKGTRGSQLDSFARRPLWEAGLDYAHGTGHGVGSFLSVHEGPQRISPVGSAQSGGDEPLQAGMILSNEPGYYKAGEYGIRIENLVLVVGRQIDGAEKEMLGFETLTHAPIERRLIAKDMLSPQELDWLNTYHAQVLAKIGPKLEGEDREWLEAACAPI